MKYLILPFILFFSLSFKAHAGSIGDVADELTESLQEAESLMMDMAAKTLDALIDCNGDDLCIIKKMEEFAQSSTNPMLQELAKEMLADNEGLIAWIKENPDYCKIPEVDAVKQTQIKCFTPVRDSFKKGEMPNGEALGFCLMTDLQKLLEEGNIYAFAFMIDFLEQMGETDYVPLLKDAFEEIKKTLTEDELMHLDKCMTAWN